MLFIPTKWNGFCVWCSFTQCKFRAVGNHYSNQGEAISDSVASLLLLETFFYASVCIYIFLPLKAVFRRSGDLFLRNPEFLFSGNSMLLFTASRSSSGNHY